MTSRSVQSISFGPSTAAVGVSAAPRSSCSSASAAGSQSSCSSQSHSTWSRPAAAGRTARHRRARSLVLDCAAHRRGVTGAAVHPEDSAWPELSRQHRAAAIPAAGVHGDDALHGLGLLGQRVHQTRQPRGTVVSDDDRGDHVLGIRVGWRQEDSLAVRVRWPGRRHASCRLALMGVPVNNTRI